MTASGSEFVVYLLCWRRHGGLQYIGLSQDLGNERADSDLLAAQSSKTGYHRDRAEQQKTWKDPSDPQ